MLLTPCNRSAQCEAGKSLSATCGRNGVNTQEVFFLTVMTCGTWLNCSIRLESSPSDSCLYVHRREKEDPRKFRCLFSHMIARIHPP